LPKLITFVFVMMMLTTISQPVWGQYYSNIDTLGVIAVGGFPGDTVSVPIYLANSFNVGGFQLRIAFDMHNFNPIAMTLTERAESFDLFGSVFNDSGVASFFATSWQPMENAIPPGAGAVVNLDLAIKILALPGIYAIRFEDSDSNSHENALTNQRGDTLIIPILVDRQFEVYSLDGVEENGVSPLLFSLSQNYPNPFNNSTAISFSLGSAQTVNLSVIDLLGRVVATLCEEPMPAGESSIIWNGTSDRGEALASGIYLYRLQIAGGNFLTKKLTLLK